MSTLTRNIDTVNRENASLKHEINKLTAELKNTEDMKHHLDNLTQSLNDKDRVIRDLNQHNDELQIHNRRLSDKIEEMKRESMSNMMIDEKGSFNQILKGHIEENIRIKERVIEKDE